MKIKRVRFGPLRYELRPLDQWAHFLISAIDNQLDLKSFHGVPDRIFYLKELDYHAGNSTALDEMCPSQFCSEIGHLDLPHLGWQITSDVTGHVFCFNEKTRYTFWTHIKAFEHFKAAYQLPLVIMHKDMQQHSGAVLHGGLIGHDKRGYLLIAPPGGGKTTAIKRVESPWKIYSDDCALVWVDPQDKCWAAPMPTWSVLIGRNQPLAAIGKWSCSEKIHLAGIYKIKKLRSLKLQALTAIEMVPALYRALCEYPAIVEERDPFKCFIFHLASRLAKSLPTGLLCLNRIDRFWENLE